MGAYAPAPLLDARALDQVGRTVIAPVLRVMREAGTPFVGVLYAGLMLTKDGPKVLEFNCRLGDPETQPLMMQLDEDLLELTLSCARGELKARTLAAKSGVSVGVVLASKGYPEAPVLGDVIEGLDAPRAADVELFHAGTKQTEKGIVTAGGRVLTVCARAQSFEAARAKAYEAVGRIRFAGMHHRRDIGTR
jgi:phosphoribosylamine--glycine ligase